MADNFTNKIQQLQTKINIVDIIGHFLKLIRKGQNYWAVCPFHEDSHPSMSVSQEKQIFKCFSCGEHGNAFIFVQNYQKVDFISAVKLAAEIAKIDLTTFNLNFSENKKKQESKTWQLNKLANNFFQYQLVTEHAQTAINYLKKRNIKQEIIDEFKLGYAPNKDQLLTYLKQQDYQEEEVVNGGLAKINQYDKVKDLFSDRIIFPIHDLNGEVIGFSGRTYQENINNKNFKYLNSPETDIFNKSNVLYNLFQAKNAVTVKNNEIIIVEGYMDVIALWKSNIKNVVATMGTNLTNGQISLLKKITNNISVFLDGDEAGKKATLKIMQTLLSAQFTVKIIDNQTTNDPDELTQNQPALLKEILKKKIHPLDFAINYLLTKYDINNNSFDLKAFIEELKPIWVTINDQITINFYLQKLEDKTKIKKADLEASLITNNFVKNSFVKSTKKNQLKFLSNKEKLIEAQKQLISLLLLNRSVYYFIEKENFLFFTKNLMNLYFLIANLYQEDEQKSYITPETIYHSLENNELLIYFKEIINKYYSLSNVFSENHLKSHLRYINFYNVELEIENASEKMQKTDNRNEQIKLLAKISQLKKKNNQNL